VQLTNGRDREHHDHDQAHAERRLPKLATRVSISRRRPHRRRERTSHRSRRSHPIANRRSRGTRSRDDILRSRDANRDSRRSHGSRDSRDGPALRLNRNAFLSLLCRRRRTLPS